MSPTGTEVEQFTGWFTKDISLTKFCERIPGLGYLVALIHGFSGNRDHAIRAVAVCTNSTIVCTGIITGTYFLGFVGALVGTVVTTLTGIWVELKIADNWMENMELRAEFDATHRRYIYETFRNTVALGTGMYASKWLGSLAPKRVDPVALSIPKRLGSKFAIWAEGPVYAVMKLTIDRFRAQIGVVLIWTQERINKLWELGKAKLSSMRCKKEKIKCA